MNLQDEIFLNITNKIVEICGVKKYDIENYRDVSSYLDDIDKHRIIDLIDFEKVYEILKNGLFNKQSEYSVFKSQGVAWVRDKKCNNKTFTVEYDKICICLDGELVKVNLDSKLEKDFYILTGILSATMTKELMTAAQFLYKIKTTQHVFELGWDFFNGLPRRGNCYDHDIFRFCDGTLYELINHEYMPVVHGVDLCDASRQMIYDRKNKDFKTRLNFIKQVIDKSKRNNYERL